MSTSGKKATDDDDVEQLLRAAQEDVLLKLSVNSHMARGSAAAAIDSDLDRLFQALKKPQKLTKRDDSAKIPPKKAAADAAPADDGDLYTRFAALKNSLPSNSGSSPRDELIDQKATDEEDEEEDEVEKVIKWAIDAARLDPSPLSDDDDDDNDEHHSNNESDYSSDDGVVRGGNQQKEMTDYMALHLRSSSDSCH